jgi:hypothetical protein
MVFSVNGFPVAPITQAPFFKQQLARLISQGIEIKDQCRDSRIEFLFKQLNGTNKKNG